MTTRRSLLLAATAVLGLATAPAFASEGKLPVVASFSILGDIVGEVGGAHVQVTTLVGPDGDAHVYQPKPADARAVAEAKVLLVNGLGFEGWMDRLVEASGFKGTIAVASEGITPLAMPEHDDEAHDDHGHDEHAHDDHDDDAHADAGHDAHDHGPTDPHAWQSLANGMVYARNVAAALSAADPANAAAYAANAAAYVEELRALDAEVRTALDKLPPTQRKVVTSHDAFGYFAQAYGITFIAPQGVSTEAEASAQDVARLIEQVREQGVRAVFVENVTDPRLIERIAAESGAVVGGALYSDALSGSDGPAPTYVAMFRHNLDELSKALVGS